MVSVMDNLALDTVSDNPPSSAPKYIPLEDILEMQSRNPNMTHEEMSTILGCSRGNISKRLRECDASVKSLDRFNKYEGKVVAGMRQRMMRALAERTDDELKEVSVRDLSVTYGVLYDKGALIDGKPTSVIAYADLCAGADQVEARLQELGVKDMTLVEVEADSPTEGEAEGELLHPTYENLTTPRPRTPGGESGEE